MIDEDEEPNTLRNIREALELVGMLLLVVLGLPMLFIAILIFLFVGIPYGVSVLGSGAALVILAMMLISPAINNNRH